MFVDQAVIEVKAGDGGAGAVSFRREKYVPRGGPDGGNGGNGGDVVLQVNPSLRTLQQFRFQQHFRGDSGRPGEGGRRQGASGAACIVKVPPGTTVRDADTGDLLGDLMQAGDKLVVARGGRGGRGNRAFRSAQRRTPRMAEQGEPGESRRLELELKLLADVGLVGFPNAGKSTLLTRISAARPKTAAYPFTTTEPHLGVVEHAPGATFVVADIPGLVEDAHKGVGLGDQFLRHVERTRLLLHLVDAAGVDGRDPVEDWRAINHELAAYGRGLERFPQLVVANKLDLPAAGEGMRRLREAAGEASVLGISAATGEGVEALLAATARRLAELEAEPPAPGQAPGVGDEGVRVYRLRPEAPLAVRYDEEAACWVVDGAQAQLLVQRLDLNQLDAVHYLNRQLERLGVVARLREAGAEDGDLVKIGEVEFLLEP